MVTLNPLKTKTVSFTLKKLDFLPQLVFDNIQICFVDNHNDLSVTISSTGQWQLHNENIVISAA